MKMVYALAKYMQYVAAVGLVVLMLLQVANMAGRLFFNAPIQGTTDLGSYILLVIVALGFGWAALQGRHVKVSLVTDRLPARFQFVLEAVILSIIMAVVAFLAYLCAWAGFTWPPRTSSVLKIPFMPFRFILAAGFAVLAICTLVVIIQHIFRRNRAGHES